MRGAGPRLGRDVAPHELKPDPAVVREMLDVVGVAPDEAIYIGDSLTKDVRVAQLAGVTDIYAAYGRAHQREQYQRLVDVTHWTKDDVERERALRENDLRPTFVAESFEDVLPIVYELESGTVRDAPRPALQPT